MNNPKKLRVLVYGDIGGSGGYIRYCKGLFGSGVSPKNVEVIFVCSTSFYEKLKPLDDGIIVKHHNWPSSPSRLKRYLWHLIIYPKIIKEYSPDVEFYPSGQLRLFFRLAPTVAACHNLLLFDLLEMTRMGNKKTQRIYWNYRDHQMRSFRKASGVIFSSKYSQNMVIKSIPSIRSSCVVPLGVEPNFCKGLKKSNRNDDQLILLYVSPLWPYKHHQEVIQAIKTLRRDLQIDLQLRLIGSGSLQATNKIKVLIESEDSSKFINLQGFVDDNTLMKEYMNADIFIFASSCEAFGITLVEAMRAHLPIACSDRTGLPDILKDAGEYFNPEDSNSIAIALSKLITDEVHRSELGEKAYQYSTDYTWKTCAERTFSFLKQIAENKWNGVL